MSTIQSLTTHYYFGFRKILLAIFSTIWSTFTLIDTQTLAFLFLHILIISTIRSLNRACIKPERYLHEVDLRVWAVGRGMWGVDSVSLTAVWVGVMV